MHTPIDASFPRPSSTAGPSAIGDGSNAGSPALPDIRGSHCIRCTPYEGPRRQRQLHQAMALTGRAIRRRQRARDQAEHSHPHPRFSQAHHHRASGGRIRWSLRSCRRACPPRLRLALRQFPQIISTCSAAMHHQMARNRPLHLCHVNQLTEAGSSRYRTGLGAPCLHRRIQPPQAPERHCAHFACARAAQHQCDATCELNTICFASAPSRSRNGAPHAATLSNRSLTAPAYHRVSQRSDPKEAPCRSSPRRRSNQPRS
jgi:hypothetical protein